MSLARRLNQSKFPKREYSTAFVMFKELNPLYKDMKSKEAATNPKTKVLFEKNKTEFEVLNRKYEADIDEWKTQNPTLAEEYRVDMLNKSNKRKANSLLRKGEGKKPASPQRGDNGDSDDSDDDDDDGDDSDRGHKRKDPPVEVKKTKVTKRPVEVKNTKRKREAVVEKSTKKLKHVDNLEEFQEFLKEEDGEGIEDLKSAFAGFASEEKHLETSLHKMQDEMSSLKQLFNSVLDMMGDLNAKFKRNKELKGEVIMTLNGIAKTMRELKRRRNGTSQMEEEEEEEEERKLTSDEDDEDEEGEEDEDD